MSEQATFIVEHRDVFRCPFCGKPYLRKQDIKYHVIMCRKNPENVHPCFWCEHLKKQDAKVFFEGIGAFGEYHEESCDVPSFYCEKHEQWLYSKISGRKRHPCSVDPEHWLMPSSCEDFMCHKSNNVQVPWSMESFIGKPWSKKHVHADAKAKEA